MSRCSACDKWELGGTDQDSDATVVLGAVARFEPRKPTGSAFMGIGIVRQEEYDAGLHPDVTREERGDLLRVICDPPDPPANVKKTQPPKRKRGKARLTPQPKGKRKVQSTHVELDPEFRIVADRWCNIMPYVSFAKNVSTMILIATGRHGGQ